LIIRYLINSCLRKPHKGWRPNCLKFLENPMKTYLCIVCGFIYDETAGRPEDGIAPGTLWADVPESWECPDCGVAKADFEAVEV
jgi:rubredoxin